jgi:hypothetical protein
MFNLCIARFALSALSVFAIHSDKRLPPRFRLKRNE